MQVSSTLIAAQQAAREAQAKFHAQVAGQVAGQPAPSFSALLNKAAEKADGFSPLPLRQTAAAPIATQAAAAPAGPISRPGSVLDIKI